MDPRPFVSVVIPTHSRPDLLRRAIDSCLVGMTAGAVEVIVVINGASAPAAPLPRRNDLRVIELEDPNGNAARNAGMAVARGEYIRFLDDDDYLLPEGTSRQYELAAQSGADVCTGAIRLTDSAGNELRTIVPRGTDLVAAVLSPSQTTQPTAHLYRRDFLAELDWNPAHQHYQDVYWMHEIARRSDVSWETLRDIVGVWQHHQGTRISTGILKRYPERALEEMESILDETIDVLGRSSRLTPLRRSAAAEGLWHCAHHGFPMRPVRWSRTALKALRLDPRARPIPQLGKAPWRFIHPLAIEWAMLPKRRLNSLLTRVRGRGPG